MKKRVCYTLSWFLVPAAVATTTPALASVTHHSPVHVAAVASSNINEADVLKAQKAWGDALVTIAETYERKGLKQAQKTAAEIIDVAYGYDMGPVLFKPTLANGEQTFRTSKDGALSYFVGHNKAFPKDSGFALKGWRKVEIRNSGLQLHGDVAMSIGHVIMTDKNGKVTTVDKTWGYKRDSQGNLKIVLHHSSLPYAG